MAFSFNFSGDDINTDLHGQEDGMRDGLDERGDGQASDTTPAVEVKAHDVKEWVGSISSSSPLSCYCQSNQKERYNLFPVTFNTLASWVTTSPFCLPA